jgi:hypothetical protein
MDESQFEHVLRKSNTISSSNSIKARTNLGDEEPTKQ